MPALDACLPRPAGGAELEAACSSPAAGDAQLTYLLTGLKKVVLTRSSPIVQAADKLDPTAALKKAFDRSGPTNPAPAAWTGDVSSLQINVATPDLNALINKVRSPVCTALSCLYCALLSVPLSPVCTALC